MHYPARKPYHKPMIVHELHLETQTAGSQPVVNDPSLIDPVLPPKEDEGSTQGGGAPIDPVLPPKPADDSSSGGSGPIDPVLPPKPPSP
jgi:hypothetical protein